MTSPTPAHNRRIKVIQLSVGGQQIEAQVSSWTFDPGQGDGERRYTGSGAEFIEDVDPQPTLQLTWFADWRSTGFSDYLMQHAGEDVAFVLDHLPDVPEEHKRLSGTLRIKPAPIGGDMRATETQQATFQVLAGYDYDPAPETP